MRILLIEDDENKRAQLMTFLSDRMPSADIITAASYHSGLWRIQEGAVDLILLDMTLPSFDITSDETGGPSELYGGRELLEQMERLDISTPVIVVTQFDSFGDQQNVITLKELDNQLAGDYPGVYLGAVYYNSAREDWKAALEKRIRDCKNAGRLK